MATGNSNMSNSFFKKIYKKTGLHKEYIISLLLKEGCCLKRLVNRWLVLVGFIPINATGCDGNTVLFDAISYENFQIAEQLIKLGASVSIKNNKGQTALQFAVTNCLHAVNKIIPKYNDFFPSADEHYCIDSFKFAVAARDKRVFKIVEYQRQRNGKAYDRAARLSLVQELLNAGADLNNRDSNGCSPLQCAVYTCDLELVKSLVEAGADIGNQNRIGATALHDAILCCDEPMVRLLLNYDASVLAKTSMNGNTPLHWAAMLNRKTSHLGIIKELLKYPVDVNSRNATGQTPFHLIIWHIDLNVLRNFNELKPDFKKVDVLTERNELHQTIYLDRIDVFDFLLEIEEIEIDKTCDALFEIFRGVTALHVACAFSFPEYIRPLLAKGANVNAKVIVSDTNAECFTPLIVCIFFFYWLDSLEEEDQISRRNMARRQAINLLFEYGSDANLKFPRLVVDEEMIIEAREMTILEKTIEEKDIMASSLIVEHVATIEARTKKPVFDDYNLAVINGNSEIKSHYERCKAELKAMKNCDIKDTLITYFAILTEPPGVLVSYARNKEVVENFQKGAYRTAYPIYGSRIRTKFDAAIVQQNLLEAVSTILSKTLRFADPSHVFFEIVFKYLRPADVNFLIDSACNKSSLNETALDESEFNQCQTFTFLALIQEQRLLLFALLLLFLFLFLETVNVFFY